MVDKQFYCSAASELESGYYVSRRKLFYFVHKEKNPYPLQKVADIHCAKLHMYKKPANPVTHETETQTQTLAAVHFITVRLALNFCGYEFLWKFNGYEISKIAL